LWYYKCHILCEGILMDLGTVIGLVLIIVLLLASMMMGVGLMPYVDIPSVMIVVGGSIGALMISFKPSQMKSFTNLFLKRIAFIIQELQNTLEVSVKGHTDDQGPGAKSIYKDNWELSSARAISVLQELLLDGVDPTRISAAGYAEFTPLATNATEEGREKNRRVELHFYGKKEENKEATQKSILDKISVKE